MLNQRAYDVQFLNCLINCSGTYGKVRCIEQEAAVTLRQATCATNGLPLYQLAVLFIAKLSIVAAARLTPPCRCTGVYSSRSLFIGT